MDALQGRGEPWEGAMVTMPGMVGTAKGGLQGGRGHAGGHGVGGEGDRRCDQQGREDISLAGSCTPGGGSTGPISVDAGGLNTDGNTDTESLMKAILQREWEEHSARRPWHEGSLGSGDNEIVSTLAGAAGALPESTASLRHFGEESNPVYCQRREDDNASLARLMLSLLPIPGIAPRLSPVETQAPRSQESLPCSGARQDQCAQYPCHAVPHLPPVSTPQSLALPRASSTGSSLSVQLLASSVSCIEVKGEPTGCREVPESLRRREPEAGWIHGAGHGPATTGLTGNGGASDRSSPAHRTAPSLPASSGSQDGDAPTNVQRSTSWRKNLLRIPDLRTPSTPQQVMMVLGETPGECAGGGPPFARERRPCVRKCEEVMVLGEGHNVERRSDGSARFHKKMRGAKGTESNRQILGAGGHSEEDPGSRPAWPGLLELTDEGLCLPRDRVALERQRRMRIREGIELLKSTIQGEGDNASILQQAINYINELKNEVNSLRRELNYSCK